MPRFFFLTDPHLITDSLLPFGENAKFDTVASLTHTVEAMQQLNADFAVVGGDLASPDMQDCSREWHSEEFDASYKALQEQLRRLPFPVHAILGNHDNRDAFHRVFGTRGRCAEGRHYYSFDVGPVHFVALDSLARGKASGDLGVAQLQWLQADLQSRRHQRTVLFLHHHPWPVGIRWLDEVGLADGKGLQAILAENSQVSEIFCGHAHLEHTSRRGHQTLFITPSTSFQLSPSSQNMELSKTGPAFRWVDIKEDTLSTSVIWL